MAKRFWKNIEREKLDDPEASPQTTAQVLEKRVATTTGMIEMALVNPSQIPAVALDFTRYTMVELIMDSQPKEVLPMQQPLSQKDKKTLGNLVAQSIPPEAALRSFRKSLKLMEAAKTMAKTRGLKPVQIFENDEHYAALIRANFTPTDYVKSKMEEYADVAARMIPAVESFMMIKLKGQPEQDERTQASVRDAKSFGAMLMVVSQAREYKSLVDDIIFYWGETGPTQLSPAVKTNILAYSKYLPDRENDLATKLFGKQLTR